MIKLRRNSKKLYNIEKKNDDYINKNITKPGKVLKYKKIKKLKGAKLSVMTFKIDNKNTLKNPEEMNTIISNLDTHKIKMTYAEWVIEDNNGNSFSCGARLGNDITNQKAFYALENMVEETIKKRNLDSNNVTKKLFRFTSIGDTVEVEKF
jgi:maltodextrin utilization protein YvdJ